MWTCTQQYSMCCFLLVTLPCLSHLRKSVKYALVLYEHTIWLLLTIWPVVNLSDVWFATNAVEMHKFVDVCSAALNNIYFKTWDPLRTSLESIFQNTHHTHSKRLHPHEHIQKHAVRCQRQEKLSLSYLSNILVCCGAFLVAICPKSRGLTLETTHSPLIKQK